MLLFVGWFGFYEGLSSRDSYRIPMVFWESSGVVVGILTSCSSSRRFLFVDGWGTILFGGSPIMARRTRDVLPM